MRLFILLITKILMFLLAIPIAALPVPPSIKALPVPSTTIDELIASNPTALVSAAADANVAANESRFEVSRGPIRFLVSSYEPGADQE
ncbi:hypothetical protein BJ508DRAFT_325516 [Ascobolus immersus RN42]|uniref:Uncharacterized protein n=1 Tax=Ascobolus immersus RN42 TaxID=1160509 RepID=A0A3N4I8W6_ASCIM|nr:hypothetical protein BJ508DRAFT_325516 [Ascobolus immersus RN42]